MPPRAPQRRPAAPVRSGRALPYGMVKLLVICLVAAIVGFGLQAIWPNGFPVKAKQAGNAAAVTTITEIHSKGPLRINELMTSNRNCLSIADGSSPDWIEIANISGNAVDIGGYQLSKSANSTTDFTFPQIWLQPDECVLVYCDSRLRETPGEDFHAPFRLSSAGDTLMLSDENSTVVESINIPALGANQSYARNSSGGWSITSEYTPGLENTSLNFARITSTQPIAGSTLVITEIMADNASYPAADGGLYDWIEITNIGTSSVNLGGYGLSDSTDQPSRWKFPAVTLEAGRSIVVYASSLTSEDSGTLHANFGLRAEGEGVLLYNPSGQVMDYVEFDNLKTDQSLKRQPDGSYSTSGTPSPGQAN